MQIKHNLARGGDDNDSILKYVETCTFIDFLVLYGLRWPGRLEGTQPNFTDLVTK